MNSNFRDLIWSIKWALIIFGAGTLIIFLGFCLPKLNEIKREMNSTSEGHEIKPAEAQKWLSSTLKHSFDYALPEGSALHGQVSGFIDPALLCLATLSEEKFDALKKAMLAKSSRDPQSDDDSLEGEPFTFAPKPWQPGQWKRPEWWNLRDGRELDIVRWSTDLNDSAEHYWIWLAYDRRATTLFVFQSSW
ncbi:MAG: hypothetical protein ABL974_01390 [Prosthecobacter sp.]